MTDIEADVLHLGCGTDLHSDAWNVDAEAVVAPDEVYDLTDYPWPERWHGVEEVRAFHVLEHLPDIERALEEIGKVLDHRGRATIKVPIGLNARADPTHQWGTSGQPWTWKTPDMVVGENHWHADNPLHVIEKDAHIWSEYHGPLRHAHHAYLYAKAVGSTSQHWKFSEPSTSGEFTVVFQKQ